MCIKSCSTKSRIGEILSALGEELKYKANGLESLIQSEAGKCVGILNGIDVNVWNPETDHYVHPYYLYTNYRLCEQCFDCSQAQLQINVPVLYSL